MFFIRDNHGGETGPFEVEAIAKQFAEGALSSFTQLRRDDQKRWRSLGSFTEFARLKTTATAAPPPAPTPTAPPPAAPEVPPETPPTAPPAPQQVLCSPFTGREHPTPPPRRHHRQAPPTRTSAPAAAPPPLPSGTHPSTTTPKFKHPPPPHSDYAPTAGPPMPPFKPLPLGGDAQDGHPAPGVTIATWAWRVWYSIVGFRFLLIAFGETPVLDTLSLLLISLVPPYLLVRYFWKKTKYNEDSAGLIFLGGTIVVWLFAY
jgi:hypothetical protein